MYLVEIENRPYSYKLIDMQNINAMLNHDDVSEYLKIGPNGLEVGVYEELYQITTLISGAM